MPLNLDVRLQYATSDNVRSKIVPSKLEMQFTLRQTTTTAEEVRQAILAPLREFNSTQTGVSEYKGLAIEVVNDCGETVGGLWGGSSYEWLFVQLLVVPSELRGKGVGRKLMELAEAEALERGCRAIWLDTFKFQAKPFYEKLGYSCFGQLPNYPTGFSRFFMKKELRRIENEA